MLPFVENIIKKGIWGKRDKVIDSKVYQGSLQKDIIPTKPRFRSVPNVAVLNSQNPLLAGLLIKCRRFPRGFFWNDVFLSLVCSSGKG